MLVELKHCKNPDIPGGYWSTMSRPRRPQQVHVTTFAEAAKRVQQYIDAYELGGGNWTGGLVRDNDGNVIAKVSYNGRVWRCRSLAESRKFPLPEIDGIYLTQEDTNASH